MKFKKTSIFLVSLLSLLTGCGTQTMTGRYGFQMGKEKGTHFGFFLTLTDEASTIEGAKPGSKKCEFSFSLGAKEGEGSDSIIGIIAMIAEVLEEQGQQITLQAYYYIGDTVTKDGEQEIKLGFDLTKIKEAYESLIVDAEIPDAPPFPQITADKVEKLIYTTYKENKVNLYIPVGQEDLLYQLYWYGIDVNMDAEQKIVFNDSPYGAHEPGTHPTADDVKAINENHNFAAIHKDFYEKIDVFNVKYRDYYTLDMGLLKQ